MAKLCLQVFSWKLFRLILHKYEHMLKDRRSIVRKGDMDND
jgi:hypothetical protein